MFFRSGVLGSHSGNMHAECVYEGSKTSTQPPPAKQPEKSQADITDIAVTSMSSTLGFNISYNQSVRIQTIT